MLLKTGTSHRTICKLTRYQSQTFPQRHDDKQLPHPAHHIIKEEVGHAWSDDKPP